MATLKIGTRSSPLALWQASQVKNLLEAQGEPCQLVPLHSDGDFNQTTPIYSMGVQGVFTRSLDAALLAGTIDLAVHSMKDVPMQLASGLVQAAVLERGPAEDVLVLNAGLAQPQPGATWHIATCSVRRRAQWLQKYPQSQVHDIRGNVDTRLQKLQQSPWHGAIFAKAGLQRIGLLPPHHTTLHWMLPAPAQGAIVVTARRQDKALLHTCQGINHEETALCTHIERSFMHSLGLGCAAPVSAQAQMHGTHISFVGNLCLPNGSALIEVSCTFALHEAEEAGAIAAQKLLAEGGGRLLQNLHHG
ncbi:MAG TPA: hydroxymethylbilane synthase [Phnomibacter sp.]|nr:hydroxymethylbilane synthase [Phnomibacter sp.]